MGSGTFRSPRSWRFLCGLRGNSAISVLRTGSPVAICVTDPALSAAKRVSILTFHPVILRDARAIASASRRISIRRRSTSVTWHSSLSAHFPAVATGCFAQVEELRHSTVPSIILDIPSRNLSGSTISRAATAIDSSQGIYQKAHRRVFLLDARLACAHILNSTHQRRNKSNHPQQLIQKVHISSLIDAERSPTRCGLTDLSSRARILPRLAGAKPQSRDLLFPPLYQTRQNVIDRCQIWVCPVGRSRQ